MTAPDAGQSDANSSAIISPCKNYRYRLERDGPGIGSTAVIMINPSTADANKDDATIRKLRGFGERNGWGRIIVGNLFAFRATDVRELGRITDPVGNPDNDLHLMRMFQVADRVVLAWGPVKKQPKWHRERWHEVMRLIDDEKPVWSIGPPTKCGHPKHPLMLPYSSPIIPWSLP